MKSDYSAVVTLELILITIVNSDIEVKSGGVGGSGGGDDGGDRGGCSGTRRSLLSNEIVVFAVHTISLFN